MTSSALIQHLQEVNDLAVMEYNYTKVGKLENALTLNGWNIPLTKKSFLLTYAGQMKPICDILTFFFLPNLCLARSFIMNAGENFLCLFCSTSFLFLSVRDTIGIRMEGSYAFFY